ncbi:MAG: YceI family protein [Nonlabens sp.]
MLQLFKLPLVLFVSFTLGYNPIVTESQHQSIREFTDYSLDKTHSFVQFKVKRFGISYVYGTFNEIDGKLDYDLNTEEVSATVTIEAKSINSNLELRDKSLRGEKFLNVANYPTITTQLVKLKTIENKQLATIAVQLLGKTKSYEIPVELITSAKDPTGKSTLAINGDLALNTEDFQMKMNKKLPNGVPLIDNKVHLKFSLLFEE